MSGDFQESSNFEFPLTSSLEEGVKTKLRNLEIKTSEELVSVLGDVYAQICGDYGAEEFFHYIVPAVLKIYTTNIQKAGLRLLEIIDNVASHKPEEASHFLLTEVIDAREIEFSKRPKEEILQEVIGRINSAIYEQMQTKGEANLGLVGVIIHGSFAKRNFHFRSDIDVVFLTDPAIKVPSAADFSLPIEERKRIFQRDKIFFRELNKKVGFELMPFLGPVDYNDEQAIRALFDYNSPWENQLLNSYIVVSPDNGIRHRVEAVLGEAARVFQK